MGDFSLALQNAKNNPDVIIVDDTRIEHEETAVSSAVSEREMTNTELLFAHELERMVVTGEVVMWAFEPGCIRIPGQSYTPDFFAIFSDSRIAFFEIKGKQALGSQSRSSVKFRWVSSIFSSEKIEFYWCKWGGVKWSIRKVVPKLPKHKQLKKKSPDIWHPG